MSDKDDQKISAEEAKKFVSMVAELYGITKISQWKKYVKENKDELPEGMPIDLKEAFPDDFKSFPKFAGITKNISTEKVIKVSIDGGRSRAKVIVNGKVVVLPSQVFECDEEDLEENSKGGFVADGIGYFVGDNADRIVSAFPKDFEEDIEDDIEGGGKVDVKVASFPYYVLSALTYSPEAFRGQTKLKIEITCVAIANQKKIAKTLEPFKSFTKDGKKYDLDMQIVSRKPEAYGSAAFVNELLKKQGSQARYFHIVDIGSGTIQILGFDTGKEPVASQPNIYGSAGMNTLKVTLADKFSAGDVFLPKGFTIPAVEEILHGATVEPNGEYKASSIDAPDHCFGKQLKAGLKIWSINNVVVSSAISDIARLLKAGNHVYLSGGAFCIPVFADFFLKHKKFAKYVKQLHLLPSPDIITLVGIDDKRRKALIEEELKKNESKPNRLLLLPPAEEPVAHLAG